MSNPLSDESRKWVESRRSQRVLLRIPILVRWQPDGQEPITEDTTTIIVNAHGALIALAMRVLAGNKIMLRNWGTTKEEECKVVHVREKPGGMNDVGIAFSFPKPGFWAIDFPPEDWQPFYE